MNKIDYQIKNECTDNNYFDLQAFQMDGFGQPLRIIINRFVRIKQ